MRHASAPPRSEEVAWTLRIEGLRADLASGDLRALAREFPAAFEALVADGRRPQALRLFLEFAPELLEHAPPALLLSVAGIAEGQRDPRLAGRAYSAVIRRAPGTAECEKAAFRQSHVLLALGAEDLAVRAWRAFSRRWPESRWMASADSRLVG